jgi:hypothetical protein
LNGRPFLGAVSNFQALRHFMTQVFTPDGGSRLRRPSREDRVFNLITSIAK